MLADDLLARQLAVQQFTEWTDLPYDSDPSRPDPARAVALVTADPACTQNLDHGVQSLLVLQRALLHVPSRPRNPTTAEPVPSAPTVTRSLEVVT
ncbi:hypothetical protein [Streptomyces sp. SID12501]|uniref:Uncharacterized protein n=1 Tax=Streptomyces sp. SID12501 TaxID=2706042 RepID=A0A6B3BW96_9ACTN|nr:hypothetical protein [Streptomyces sp. SID12501]NEC88657.1 hypothetical protein [Streptomyces sp. SID12501]